jgi:RNA-directed DNA polymerase
VVKCRAAPNALKVFKRRVRRITGRNGGKSLASVVAELGMYLPGWREYFRLAETPGIFRELDQWIARRLRMLVLKQWKQGTTVFRELRRRGVPVRVARAAAAHARSWWRTSAHGALNTALPRLYFDRIGVPRLTSH